MRNFIATTLWMFFLCTFSAQAQQSFTVCQGDTVQLTASGADLYEWLPHTGLDDPFSATPKASPSITTTYTVRRLRTSDDLITNGNFNAGYSGFTSNYRDSTNIEIEGFFAVTNNPRNNHSAMNPCVDHTTGSGNFLVANGGPIANQIVWKQDINVTPNTNYAFSSYVNAGVSTGSFAILQFSINGQLIGEQYSTKYSQCTWERFYSVWNSGSNTRATIAIVNQNLAREGNDFGIDDIFFQSFTVLTDSTKIVVKPADAPPRVMVTGDITPCDGDSVVLEGPLGAPSYRWNDGVITRARTLYSSSNVSLRVLGANGCFSLPSDLQSVVVQPIPNAPIVTLVPGKPTQICPGDSSEFRASDAPGYLWSNGTTTQNVVAKAAGTYSVRAISAQGCASVPSNGITLSVRSRPTQPRVTLSGDTLFCAGGSLTITSSYNINNRWSTGETTPSITVTQPGTYWVFAQSTTSCPSLKRFVTVAVGGPNNRPVVTTNGPTTICPGSSVTLTSNFATGNTWSNGATSQSITVSTGGQYTVTATSSCGVSTSVPVVVTISTVPNAPTISAPADRALCIGDSIILTSSVASGNVWSTGATTQSITVFDAGTYTVRQQVGSCFTAESQPIVVTLSAKPTTPVITASGGTRFCSGNSVTLLSSGTANNLWSNGATTQSLVVSTSGTYYVRAQSIACASDTSNKIVVTVLATPAAPAISAPITTACQGQSVTLTANPGTNVVWSTGQTGSTVSVSTVGTTAVTARTIASSGCQSPASAVVNVLINPTPALPTISPNGSVSICSGTPVTLTSSSANTVWSTGATSATISVTTSGSYTARAVVAGCSSAVSAPVVVTINQVPSTPSITNATGSTTICSGASITLTSSSATGNLWSTGETTQSITVTPSSSSNYTVRAVANGCSSAVSSPIAITVNATPAVPTITTNGTTTVCSGASVILTSSAANTLWSTGGTTNTLSVTASGSYTAIAVANGCSSAVSQPVVVTVSQTPVTPTITNSGSNSICSGSSITLTSSLATGNVWSTGETTQSITVTPGSSSNYTVRAVANGCSSAVSTPVAITVNATPAVPTVTVNGSTTVCSGTPVTLTSSAANTLWSTGGTTNTLSVTASGSYTAIAVANGCSSAVSQPVVVTVSQTPATPTITNSGSNIICSGSSITLTSSLATGNLWSTGETTQSITVTPGSSSNYTVRAVANGCSSAVSTPVAITVNPTPAAPTLSALSSATFCAGGSVDLRASTPDVVWNTNATTQNINVTTAGTFTARTISLGCTSAVSAPINVVVNPVPTVPTVTPGGNRILCAGSTLTLSSTDPNTLWNTGTTGATIVVSTAGTYTARAFTAACTSAVSASTTVTVEALPVQSTVVAVGLDSAQSTVVGTSYIWKLDNNLLPNEARTIQVTATGNYTVSVISANGCQSPVSAPTFITVTGLSNRTLAQPLTLSPNPASASLTLSGTDGLTDVYVIDALGRTVLSAIGKGIGQLSLSVQHLPAGSYTVKGISKKGLSMGKFIKE